MRRGDFGKELKKKLNDRRCGYIGCLDYSLDIKGIQAWCLKMELAAFQKKRKSRFKNIVAEFMQKINDLNEKPEIYYSSQLEEMVYQEGNNTMPITMLSAGYQSLLWIEFILTTHSPIVISSCKNEHLILITDDQTITIYLPCMRQRSLHNRSPVQQ